MKKISIVVQTKNQESTLASLRELGLVHLEDFQCSSPAVQATMDKKNRANAAYIYLSEYKPKKLMPPLVLNPESVIEDVLRLGEDIQAFKDQAIYMDKEIAELSVWGDFSPDDFRLLAAKGYYIKLYSGSGEQYRKINDLEGDVVILRHDKDGFVFAHIAKRPVILDYFNHFPLPAQSLSAMRAEREVVARKIAELNERAYRYYACRPSLAKHMEQLEAELEYQVAKANALEEGSLTAIVGYHPADTTEAIRTWASQNSIALAITDPNPGDAIPTLVQNPKWLEVIRPVFKFLGTVPGYEELDISVFFLAFFLIFFAMIIGDAAYGTIFFFGGLAVVLRSKSKQGKPPLAGWLFTFLGLATIAWGAMNGSWFGSAELIKGTFLESLVVRQLVEGFSVYNPAGELYKVISGQDVIKLICFMIALIHLTIAQTWNLLREIANRSLKAIAQLAWIGINFGLFQLVLSMVMYFDLDLAFGTGGAIARISLILILGGLALVVLFGSQEGDFVKGALAGLGGILPTALGTVSAFGDIISYIRLFAVGLAGVEIAKSFNLMASGLLQGNTFIFGVLVLVLGHTLNFVLCCLGVLVHGIRLNMLEFSGRLGMGWSGQVYNPFKSREGVTDKKISVDTREEILAVSCASDD
ncbi:MAG TPA: hypothetical protein VK861_11535 [Bacteroidales bacterium]|nr:hypothetical protein [Bacteroidales bacterium]